MIDFREAEIDLVTFRLYFTAIAESYCAWDCHFQRENIGRHDNGVNVDPFRGCEIKNANNCVCELYGEPLGLTLPRIALVAFVVMLAIFRVNSARSINERLSVPIFLESLRYFRVNEGGYLREFPRLFPPPM